MYLRRLIFEEYGRPGLPIFRYVIIETDDGARWDDPELPSNGSEDFDKLNMINASITNTQVIKDKLEPDNPTYNENLVQWLDANLLDIPGNQFVDGAANIRMAGRLCLWENWGKITGRLNDYLDAIIAETNIQRTNEILRQYYTRKQISMTTQGNNTPDIADKVKAKLIENQNRNIFIVGSLCGGTCGGMMTDLVYWLRSQLGLWSKLPDDDTSTSQIYGIFTILDSKLANEKENQIFAANCFTSLKEVDFYNHPSSLYNVTFPSGESTGDRNDSPFDYLLTVSPSGKTPAIRFVDENGQVELKGLNQMVAMNLFADVVAGSGEMKGAIRTDWRQHEKYNRPKETNQLTRSLATFGASAVWYPKYRISGAAADLIGAENCQAWMRDVTDRNKYKNKAKSEWDRILKENIGILTQLTDAKPLKNELDELVSQIRSQFMRCESTAQLQNQIKNAPLQGTPMADRFGPKGEYYNTIKQQMSLCGRALRDAVDELIQREIDNLGFSGEVSLGDAMYFFDMLDETIAADEKRCPERMPNLNVDSISLKGLEIAESNRWTKIIGLKKQAILQQKESICNEYEHQVNQAFIDLRNYFLKYVLQNLRRHLGIRMQPQGAVPDNYRTVKESLDAMTKKVQNCEALFKDDYEHLIEPRKQMNVRIIVNNANNSLAEDVQAVKNGVDVLEQTEKTQIYNEILERSGRSMSLTEFFQQSEQEIFLRIKQVYQRHALRTISQFDVAKQGRAKLGAELVELAQRSNPYQNFDARYVPAKLQRLPNLICGRESQVLDELRRYMVQHRLNFERISPSPLEHLLIFYMEEAAFAIDDLASAQSLEKCYRTSRAQYGHHTHQNPSAFDPLKFFRKMEMERWVRVALELIPDEVFKASRNGWLFEWQNLRGFKDAVNVENKREIAFLAEENLNGYEKCITAIRKALSHHGRNEVVQLINQTGKYSEDRAFYDVILKDLFGDEIPEPSEQIAVEDDSLSRTTAQAEIPDEVEDLKPPFPQAVQPTEETQRPQFVDSSTPLDDSNASEETFDDKLTEQPDEVTDEDALLKQIEEEEPVSSIPESDSLEGLKFEDASSPLDKIDTTEIEEDSVQPQIPEASVEAKLDSSEEEPTFEDVSSTLDESDKTSISEDFVLLQRTTKPEEIKSDASEETILEDTSSEIIDVEVDSEKVQFWTEAALSLIPEIFTETDDGEHAFEYEGKLYPVHQLSVFDSDELKQVYVDSVLQGFQLLGHDEVKSRIENADDYESNSKFYDELLEEI